MLQLDEIPTDERACAAVLVRLRWPDGWTCGGCGSSSYTHLRSRPRILECNACRGQRSVTAGTPLHRCRLPLTKVLHAALWLARRVTTSSRQLARLLGVSVETAWTLAHKLRSGVVGRAPRLHGRLRFGSVRLVHRPPPGHERFAWSLYATVLWDESGVIVARAGASHPADLRRFVDDHADAVRADHGPCGLFHELAGEADRAHRGVSARWFPHYLAAMAAWPRLQRAGQAPLEVVLGPTLSRATRGLVRPHPPPLRPGLEDWGRWSL